VHRTGIRVLAKRPAKPGLPALMIEIPKRALIFDKDYLNKITDVFVQTIEQNLKQKARSDKANDE